MTGGLRIVGGAAAAGAQSYTLAAVQSLLGLSRSMIESLVALGFVAPGRGRRQEYLFSFQDVVLLRTAAGLQAAKIPARKRAGPTRAGGKPAPAAAAVPAEAPKRAARGGRR